MVGSKNEFLCLSIISVLAELAQMHIVVYDGHLHIYIFSFESQLVEISYVWHVRNNAMHFLYGIICYPVLTKNNSLVAHTVCPKGYGSFLNGNKGACAHWTDCMTITAVRYGEWEIKVVELLKQLFNPFCRVFFRQFRVLIHVTVLCTVYTLSKPEIA